LSNSVIVVQFILTGNCKIHAKILLKALMYFPSTECDFFRLFVFYAHVILNMCIICVYKNKVVFFVYIIANRMNILEKSTGDT